MQEYIVFRKLFLIRYAGIFLVLILPLLIAGFFEAARGFAFGAVLAGLFFIVQGQILSRAFSMPSLRARIFIFSHYLLRYTLYFLALTGSVQREEFHFLGVTAGLILPRLVILIFYTFKNGIMQPVKD